MNKEGMEIKVNLDRATRAALDAGQYVELLRSTPASGRRVQTVDFTLPGPKKESFSTGKYKIKLGSFVEHGDELVLLFPNHEREKCQMLQTRTYAKTALASMNLTINERLSASGDYSEAAGTTRLAVCYGQHVFLCSNIRGTVYIFWAAYINRANNGNVPNSVFSNVPLVMCCDGEGHVMSIFVLKPQVTEPSDLERLPVCRGNPELLFNARDNLFVCEKRAVQQKQHHLTRVRMISKRDALSMLQSTSKGAVTLSRNPYEESVDVEEGGGLECLSDAALAHLSHVPDDGTPRSDLFEASNSDSDDGDKQ